MGLLSINKEINILDTVAGSDGKTRYYIAYNGINGYVSAEFIVLNNQPGYETDADFEADLNAQGFPESYKPYLRSLHAQYPNWKFRAAKTGLSWSSVLEGESKLGKSLVPSSSISSWKSKAAGAYDPQTGKYTNFDSGGWVMASDKIIAYYLDPRNFINGVGIFQFLTHAYDAGTQTDAGLAAVVSGTFLDAAFPEGGFATYADVLMEVGRTTEVNPYVLASMILVEQGSSGTGKCISGTVSGYEGYYNFYNIGAYKTSSMSAITRGLWYASQSGTYHRPWDSRYDALLGGALFYSENYVKRNKNTLYFKKWNVMNGLANVGEGQYMTNVQGAESEAAALRKGYLALLDSPMTFEIPIYSGMPASACTKPTSWPRRSPPWSRSRRASSKTSCCARSAKGSSSATSRTSCAPRSPPSAATPTCCAIPICRRRCMTSSAGSSWKRANASAAWSTTCWPCSTSRTARAPSTSRASTCTTSRKACSTRYAPCSTSARRTHGSKARRPTCWATAISCAR